VRIFEKARWGRVQEENRVSETDSPAAPEIQESHRDRQIWWALATLGVVIFVAVIFLGRPLVSGRLTAARNLDRATAMVKETNVDLAALDVAVRASASTGAPTNAKDTLTKLWATRRKLEAASALSQNGFDRLTEDEQRRAKIVKTMAAARLEVLVAAEMVVSNGGAVNDQAQREYEAALEKVRQADAALAKM
jgi:hypothetical protein